jgi:hypothetical protein
LRRTGPSMKFIMRHLPPDSPLTAKDIFRKWWHFISYTWWRGVSCSFALSQNL